MPIYYPNVLDHRRKELSMLNLDKQPAFFPAVGLELFFESEAETSTSVIFDAELDAELDSILAAV
jgi:hypothetical protein